MKSVADASVDARKPRTNFGRKRVLSLSARGRGYFRFKTKRMPESIVRAKLFVYVTSGRGDLNVSGVNGKWRERTITFKNAPHLSPPVAEAAVGTGGWTGIDVTSLVGFARTVDLVVAPVERGTHEHREPRISRTPSPARARPR